jgi:hypothetical protein
MDSKKLTTTGRCDPLAIAILVSLCLNGFLVGAIVSHLHFWAQCPVCVCEECCRD